MKTNTIKVLLIEEDEDDYTRTRDLLSEVKFGTYTLDWAPSYEEGLSLVARGEHQVCLVDYRLGERNGVELIREARESGLSTPMILLTGQGNRELDLEAMEAGAIGYLVKDETPTARLERTIRYAIEISDEHYRAEALGAYAQRHAAVAEIGRLALMGSELHDLFAEAVLLVARTLGVEYCRILELLPAADLFVLRAGTGWSEEFVVGQAIVSAGLETQAGFTMHSDQPLVVEDLRTETRFSVPPLLHEDGIVSGMSVIIRGRERPYGVLEAHSTSMRKFAAEDVNFLRSVSNVLAEAVIRKRTEEGLRKREALLSNAQRVGGMGIWELDVPRNHLTWSEETHQIFGVAPKDFNNTFEAFFAFVHPADVERMKAIYSQSPSDGSPVEAEYRIQRPDGEERVLFERGEITFDHEGRPHRKMGVVMDITALKQKESALRDAEDKYSSIFENSNEGIFQNTPDGRMISANPALARMLGYATPEELIQDRTDLESQSYAEPALREEFTRLLEERDFIDGFEYQIRRKDGTSIWVSENTRIVRDLSGTAVRYEGSIQEITERKNAEAGTARLLWELESEKARLTDLFTHAPAFIASLHGPSHIFELANSQYYALVGPRDLIGKTVREAVPEAEGQGFFELLDTVYASGVPFVGNEMPFAVGDESGGPRQTHYLNFVYQPMKDTDGAVSGIICHGVDVTEQVLSRLRLEATETQLRQSQKLESVGMLAGGIAHDFNNLLTVITGYSELALKRLDKADPLATNLREIKKAGASAASLTRQLLAFSRKQVLQPKALNLNSAIANIEIMLGRLVGEDMDIRVFPAVNLGQVMADPGQVEQVILNLVINARDAMPQGGNITIETANIYLTEEYAARHIAVQPGWYAMLAVTDTGEGMDAETQQSIFDPFFTTKEQGKGTGLGLSTVYGIVKQSSGNLWVYSEVGVGTCFKVYLPLVDQPVTPPDDYPTHPDGTNSGKTILVAEDEDMVRTLARESLIMYGHTVLEAANAAEALEICKQHKGPIDLLLTDVVMPRMGGRELAEQLGKLRPDTQVLYMSGYTDQAIVHNGVLDSGINFIGKPFTPDSLALKVDAVLSNQAEFSASREESMRMANHERETETSK